MAKAIQQFEVLKEDQLEGILPCPFCGEYSLDKQNELAKVTDKHGWKRIECQGCGCSPSFCEHSWEETIRKWNSRVDFGTSNEFYRGIETYKRFLLDLIKEG